MKDAATLVLQRNIGTTWGHLSMFALDQGLQIYEQIPDFQSVGQHENYGEVVLTTKEIVVE